MKLLRESESWLCYRAYNAGGTLERTIGEVLPGVVGELHLVDDASGDDTVEVAERQEAPSP